MTHTVYLVDLNYEVDGFRNLAVCGVRAARLVAGDDETVGSALVTVNEFVANPSVAALVATCANEETAALAAEALEEESNGAAVAAIDLLDVVLEQAEEAEEAEDDEEFSPAAYRTAIAMMATCLGDQSVAYVRCDLLRRTTDDELWDEVKDVYESIFTMRTGEFPDFFSE